MTLRSTLVHHFRRRQAPRAHPGRRHGDRSVPDGVGTFELPSAYRATRYWYHDLEELYITRAVHSITHSDSSPRSGGAAPAATELAAAQRHALDGERMDALHEAGARGDARAQVVEAALADHVVRRDDDAQLGQEGGGAEGVETVTETPGGNVYAKTGRAVGDRGVERLAAT